MLTLRGVIASDLLGQAWDRKKQKSDEVLAAESEGTEGAGREGQPKGWTAGQRFGTKARYAEGRQDHRSSSMDPVRPIQTS